MCDWLTGEWVKCQLTHMELQSQLNYTDNEIVQNELKLFEPMLSAAHSKGNHKCFLRNCGNKGCCQ